MSRLLQPTELKVQIDLCSLRNKADDRTRTDNLLITNQLLCQLSHIGIFIFSAEQLICNQALPAIDAVNLIKLSRIGIFTSYLF